MSCFCSRTHILILVRTVVAPAALIVSALNSVANCVSSEIHIAALKGNLERVKVLVEGNPDLVFSEDKDGETPLLGAAREDHTKVAELLLSSGADVNVQGGEDHATPLLLAVRHGDRGLVELLLTSGADVNVRGSNNDSALFFAARDGRKEIAELLLARGDSSMPEARLASAP